jgi:hypothetical protein
MRPASFIRRLISLDGIGHHPHFVGRVAICLNIGEQGAHLPIGGIHPIQQLAKPLPRRRGGDAPENVPTVPAARPLGPGRPSIHRWIQVGDNQSASPG